MISSSCCRCFYHVLFIPIRKHVRIIIRLFESIHLFRLPGEGEEIAMKNAGISSREPSLYPGSGRTIENLPEMKSTHQWIFVWIFCLIYGSIITQLFHFNCHPLTWSHRCFRHNYLYSLHTERITAFMRAEEVLQLIVYMYNLGSGSGNFRVISSSHGPSNPSFVDQQTVPMLVENSLLSPLPLGDPKGHAANPKGMQKTVKYFHSSIFPLTGEYFVRGNISHWKTDGKFFNQRKRMHNTINYNSENIFTKTERKILLNCLAWHQNFSIWSVSVVPNIFSIVNKVQDGQGGAVMLSLGGRADCTAKSVQRSRSVREIRELWRKISVVYEMP